MVNSSTFAVLSSRVRPGLRIEGLWDKERGAGFVELVSGEQ